ncbi:MAG: hypothetical protein IPI49_11660 [Myxococcales bacterium]|nr:hypothetical protein [Myxococcales bacterium]
MAYGSAASLAAILTETEAHADPVALGRDVSLEFLRATAVNARVIDVNVKDPREVGAVLLQEKPDAALVISNHSNLRAYADAKVPVFFVDVLFWYGEHKDEALWARFEQGFALDFPGVRSRIDALGWGRPPTVVGPLLRGLPARAKAPHGTLVNLGGVRSVFVTPDRARAGLAIVAHALRSTEHALPPGEIIIACGADAAAVIRPLLPSSMRVGALPPAEYDACLQSSALLLTVPGLNAVLEGMAAEIPLAFLPALNASQCLQLRRYQQAGVGASGIELDRYVDLAIPERVTDEQALTGEVIAALERVASSASQLEAMADAVRAQLPVPADLTQRRQEFVNALGVPGARPIARALIEWWRARTP